MKCRLCEKYEWDDPQEVLEGKDYCVFHAPVDEKGINGDAFKHHFRAAIIEVYGGRPSSIRLNVSGIIVPDGAGDLFNDLKVVALRCENSKFYGDTVFSQESFRETTSFKNAKFYGDVEFNTTFNYIVDFSGAEFFEDANFEKVKFKDKAKFLGTKFHGTSSFKSVSFKYTDFSKVEFNKCSFDAATFKDETLFKHTNVFSASFNSVKIELGLIFRNIESLDAWFPHTDMEKIKFEKCSWKTRKVKNLVRIRLGIEDKGVRDSEEFYRIMKQKALSEGNQIEASAWHLAEREMIFNQLKTVKFWEVTIQALPVLWDSVKCWAGNKVLWILRSKKTVDLSEFEAREQRAKEAAEKKSRFFLRFALWIYRWSSGYGEDPWRSAKSLVLLLGACFVFLGLIGVESKEKIIYGLFSPSFSLQGVANFKEMVLTTLKSVLLFKQSEMAFSPSSHWLLIPFIIVSRVFIPIQVALLAFALRNKFRR